MAHIFTCDYKMYCIFLCLFVCCKSALYVLLIFGGSVNADSLPPKYIDDWNVTNGNTIILIMSSLF